MLDLPSMTANTFCRGVQICAESLSRSYTYRSLNMVVNMSFQELTVEALLSEVGVRVRGARLSKNMSQEQLALESGLSRSTIKRLESGRDSVSLSNLLSVMQVLDMVDSFIEIFPEIVTEGVQRRRASRKRSEA